MQNLERPLTPMEVMLNEQVASADRARAKFCRQLKEGAVPIEEHSLGDAMERFVLRESGIRGILTLLQAGDKTVIVNILGETTPVRISKYTSKHLRDTGVTINSFYTEQLAQLAQRMTKAVMSQRTAAKNGEQFFSLNIE